MAKSTAELRGLSVPELEGRLVEIKSDLARERALIASGTRAEKPSKIGE
ncbi:MAG: 50S ribosomal protein L29 [Candidatus Diapherotrites archaeon]|uniref:50S ribosomal protein L29 n=1 Tax=Candidatus Iainarchaeum sp. TaxID=3101447 RepID=A0A8T4L0E3_9ARCH|nr:50S ribosomal protein L29 [Candidatus Diapherotrites archaeon]